MTETIRTKNWISKATKFAKDFEIQGKKYTWEQLDDTVYMYLEEEIIELKEALRARDLVEIIDGAGDVAFIALNVIYKLGRLKGLSHTSANSLVDLVMNQISDSNLTKMTEDGKVLRDESTGKVLKPEGYRKPDLEGLV